MFCRGFIGVYANAKGTVKRMVRLRVVSRVKSVLCSL